MASYAKLTSDAEWRAIKRLQRRYQLKAGPEIFATLEFPSAFGSLAEAEAADGHWTFKRGGFLRPQVTVREAGTERDLGQFRARWSGDGVLELASGAAYEWTGRGFWRAQWTWTQRAGGDLLHLAPKSVLQAAAQVELEVAARKCPDLGMLATLGWYLIVLTAEESSAAVVATMG